MLIEVNDMFRLRGGRDAYGTIWYVEHYSLNEIMGTWGWRRYTRDLPALRMLDYLLDHECPEDALQRFVGVASESDSLFQAQYIARLRAA